MNRRVIATLMLCAAGATFVSAASASVVASNQGSGQDGFVYAFSKVPGPVSNGFSVIPAGQTTNGHSTEALVQFDMSLVGMTAAQVTSATLSLFVTDPSTVGFGLSPSPGQPLQVDVHPITSVWDRDTVKWSIKPTFGSVLTSEVITGDGIWVNFDITSTVQDWLTTPATNYGVLLRGNAAVGSSPDWIYSNFVSGFGDLAENAPVLTVAPEPAGLVLAACAAPILAWAAGRRRVRRRVPLR